MATYKADLRLAPSRMSDEVTRWELCPFDPTLERAFWILASELGEHRAVALCREFALDMALARGNWVLTSEVIHDWVSRRHELRGFLMNSILERVAVRERQVFPQSRRTAAPTRTCEARGCSMVTREGKPYCPVHLDLHPYVNQVMADLAARREEEARVEREGPHAVDPTGLTAQELLHVLEEHGPRTLERLSRDLQLSSRAVLSYVTTLRRLGWVTLGKTTRGSTVVGLATDGEDLN